MFSAQKICDFIVKTFDQHWNIKSPKTILQSYAFIYTNKNVNVEAFSLFIKM